MSVSLVTLTIGIVPIQGVLPFLTEYIDENNIPHHSLLGKLSREEVMAEYAPEAGEDIILTLLNDNYLVHVSRRKVERDSQGMVEMLDNQGYNVIMSMNIININSMTVRNTIFLEPSRILPPLVSSIVEGYQVGVIVLVEEVLPVQVQKWQILQKSSVSSLGNPIHDSKQKIIDARKELLARGIDVVMLDYLGFHQRHRDLLQKQLNVPVLLFNALTAWLAAELLTQLCVTASTSGPYSEVDV